MAESILQNRLGLLDYVLGSEWKHESVTKVGLMLRNVPEGRQEELALHIRQTIEGLNEEEAIDKLKDFPEFPSERQFDTFVDLGDTSRVVLPKDCMIMESTWQINTKDEEDKEGLFVDGEQISDEFYHAYMTEVIHPARLEEMIKNDKHINDHIMVYKDCKHMETTYLEDAIIGEDEEVVELLLKYGADPNMKESYPNFGIPILDDLTVFEGRTVWDVYHARNQLRMIQLFLEYGADCLGPNRFKEMTIYDEVKERVDSGFDFDGFSAAVLKLFDLALEGKVDQVDVADVLHWKIGRRTLCLDFTPNYKRWKEIIKY